MQRRGPLEPRTGGHAASPPPGPRRWGSRTGNRSAVGGSRAPHASTASPPRRGGERGGGASGTRRPRPPPGAAVARAPGAATHHHLLKNALELRLHLHHRPASRGRPARGPGCGPSSGHGPAEQRRRRGDPRGDGLAFHSRARRNPPWGPANHRSRNGSAGKCLVFPDHQTPRNQGASRWFRRRGRTARELDPSAPQWNLEPKSRQGAVG